MAKNTTTRTATVPDLDREAKVYTFSWIDQMSRRLATLEKDRALIVHPTDARFLAAALYVYRQAITESEQPAHIDVPTFRPSWITPAWER